MKPFRKESVGEECSNLVSLQQVLAQLNKIGKKHFPANTCKPDRDWFGAQNKLNPRTCGSGCKNRVKVFPVSATQTSAFYSLSLLRIFFSLDGCLVQWDPSVTNFKREGVKPVNLSSELVWNKVKRKRNVTC